MPEPAFVRDPNLLHLLKSMRENIMAAHGAKNGSGFLPRAEYAAAGTAGGGTSRSAAAAAGGWLKTVRCAYDATAGVGGSGTHYLAAVLPAGSVLIRAFCVVQNGFAGGVGAKLAIRAGDGADEIDVFEESELASAWAPGYHGSIEVGQSATARARAFKAVVSGGDISAGKLLFFAECAVCDG